MAKNQTLATQRSADPVSDLRASQYLRHESQRLYDEELIAVSSKTDRLFSTIMLIQWAVALFVSATLPRNARFGASHHYLGLIGAIVGGGILTLATVLASPRNVGLVQRRYVNALAQIMISVLLVVLTGDPNGMQFHLYGSLAFIAFYLDWKVLLSSSLLRLGAQVFINYLLLGSLDITSLVNLALCVACFDVIVYASSLYRLRTLHASAKRDVEQEVLLHQAYHDPLTGLGNRLKIKKILDDLRFREGDERARYALMVIDLDRFKQVNDTFGHHIGDEVLTEASRRMKEVVSAGDTVIRMGGDEFAIILAACSELKLAESVAARVVHIMAQPMLCSGEVIEIGASVGICLHGEDPFVNADIFHFADLALYKAKSQGRNGFAAFDENMRMETSQGISLEQRLRRAVQKEKFVVFYQPIIKISGALQGFEALLRWDDEVHGPVSPMQFIPLAEKMDLMNPLGKWVLINACKQASLWQGLSMDPISMSVNVSSLQLANPGFVEVVKSALRESELPARLLILELTEHTLVENRGQAFETLRLLRQIGVQLAIDDFGTGYSSLSYLREMPVQSLKIDRAFITDIVGSPKARLLVEEVVRLAHTMKLRTVAEGVENKEQWEILSDLHCDEIQGFHIAHAMSANDATKLLFRGSFETTEMVEEAPPSNLIPITGGVTREIELPVLRDEGPRRLTRSA